MSGAVRSLPCRATEESFDMGGSAAKALAAAAAFLALSATSPAVAADIDADAAMALARRESCLKCHAVDKEKSGPAYAQVAAKYQGKADAEEHLITHLKSGKTIMVDDVEEEHRIIKTADEAQIRNLVQWILSRKKQDAR